MDITSSLAQMSIWVDEFCLMSPYVFVWPNTLEKVWFLKGQPDGLTGNIHFAARKKHYPIVCKALSANTPITWTEIKRGKDKIYTSVIDYIPLFDEKLDREVKVYLHQIPEWLEHYVKNPDLCTFGYEPFRLPNPYEGFMRAFSSKHERVNPLLEKAIPLEEEE